MFVLGVVFSVFLRMVYLFTFLNMWLNILFIFGKLFFIFLLKNCFCSILPLSTSSRTSITCLSTLILLKLDFRPIRANLLLLDLSESQLNTQNLHCYLYSGCVHTPVYFSTVITLTFSFGSKSASICSILGIPKFSNEYL